MVTQFHNANLANDAPFNIDMLTSMLYTIDICLDFQAQKNQSTCLSVGIFDSCSKCLVQHPSHSPLFVFFSRLHGFSGSHC